MNYSRLWVLALISFGLIPSGVNASGLVSDRQQKKLSAVERAAVFLQASELRSGGWSWDMSKPGVSPNYGGIVAESLLSAYEQTGEKKFLDSAEAYARLLQKRFAQNSLARPYRPDIEFLVRMSEVSGREQYAKLATQWFRVLQREQPQAAGEINRLIQGRSAQANLVGFDAALDIRAALAVGAFDYAKDLADATLAMRSQWLTKPNARYGIVARAAFLDALQMLDGERFDQEAAKLRAELIAAQDENGSWNNNATQATAYAVRALAMSNDVKAQQTAIRGSDWLRLRMLRRGAWAEYHDGMPEPFHGRVISEVHAEALSAMILTAQL